MCLIVFAWKSHPDYELVVAANRDEFHRRPSEEAHWWSDHPGVLAGRDTLAGGTWLAVSRDGRFSTVTNYREQSFTRGSYKSRGSLVAEFVYGGQSPAGFSSTVDGDDYAGFNLLSADRHSMSYVSNRGDMIANIPPGIYGLSNASLDTPWSKVTRSKVGLSRLIETGALGEDSLLELLGDRETAAEDVNSEHLTREQARAITAPFIISPEYGTRCSTLLLMRSSGEVQFVERRFDTLGDSTGTTRFEFVAEDQRQS